MKVDSRFIRLSQIMNTAPACVADLYGTSPAKIERLLKSRSQLDKELCLYECIEKYYGKEAVQLCHDLVCVCPIIETEQIDEKSVASTRAEWYNTPPEKDKE